MLAKMQRKVKELESEKKELQGKVLEKMQEKANEDYPKKQDWESDTEHEKTSYYIESYQVSRRSLACCSVFVP